ncbi:MAG TPA: helix-turn-helix domain-containing protein [Mesorhizobium sp.]|jgi:DNA-binding HxlR family transcriptional regulator|nr:helix-turn-helix domain-containing protein [Mesorhizobium sp.]
MKLEKITYDAESRTKRRYEDACGTAHALELVGERWALLVMRELMLGPKRFNDLKADLPGISANVLTQRLEGLEEAGVVVRRKLPPPASVSVYELTPWGYEAAPIVEVLGRWAARSPRHDPTLPISAVSIMLSFRTMFSPERAEGFSARVGFRLGRESFLAEVGDGRFSVARADDLSGADAIFTGAPAALAAAVYGGQDFDMLAGEGALQVTGDRAAAERFRTLFVLPPKAA